MLPLVSVYALLPLPRPKRVIGVAQVIFTFLVSAAFASVTHQYLMAPF